MPGGDRTGPAGAGRMTGRAAGFCAGNDVPGYLDRAARGGRGRYGRRRSRWLWIAGIIPGCVYLISRLAKRTRTP